MKRRRCNDVVRRRSLIIYPYRFACPYCGRSVPRGGHGEGFRKAGLSRHVFACWEILLYGRGYLIGAYTMNGHVADRVEDALAGKAGWSADAARRVVRAIKAAIRKRELCRQVPAVPQ